MKKLLAVALIILPITSQALEQKDCTDLYGFAEVIMGSKSAGIDISDSLGALSKSEFNELLTAVTIDAYSQHTYNTKSMNQKAAKNFAAKWLGLCMKAIG